MVIVFLNIISCFFIVTSSASASVKVQSKPDLLTKMETKYKNSKTFSANFVQKNHSLVLKKEKISKGILEVKFPGFFRWETHSPQKSVLVSNEKAVWVYTPPFDETERGQAIKTKPNTQSQIAADLMLGKISIGKDFKLISETKNRFELKPLEKKWTDIKKVTLEINPETHLIDRLKLELVGGNTTELQFEKIELGGELPDSLFYFNPPSNTDVLEH